MHMITLDPTRVHLAPPRLFLAPTRLSSSYSTNPNSISFSRVGPKPNPFHSLSLLNHHQQQTYVTLNSKNKTHVRTETKLYGHSSANETEESEDKEEEEKMKQQLELELEHEHEHEGENERELKLGLIKKGYGIVAVEVLLTALAYVAAAMNPKITETLLANPVFLCSVIISVILCFVALQGYIKRSFPDSMRARVFSLCWCVLIGACGVLINGRIVLGALVLTSIAVSSITAYTFRAYKKGKDLGHLDLLSVSSIILMIITTLTLCFHLLGPSSTALYRSIEALMYSSWVLCDATMLLKHLQYDEWVLCDTNMLLKHLRYEYAVATYRPIILILCFRVFAIMRFWCR